MLSFVDPAGKEVLSALGIMSCEDAILFRAGELVREMPGRETWRVDSSAGVLFLKKHLHSSLGTRWLRPSPARSEFQRHLELQELGFSVPPVIGCGEMPGRFGSLAASFLLTKSAGDRTLLSQLQGGHHPPRSWWLELAVELRRFHDAGFFHRDFYANHLHLADQQDWGRPCMIDLQRVVRRNSPRRRWLVKDLAALHCSCGDFLKEERHHEFLLRYLGKDLADSESDWWRQQILRKSKAIASHVPLYP
ncbi:MAG: hypothetical protein COB96_02155 [Planctomycetota bacterium]|nr:MAG: hypothetical protein COB96_02155 [Planctomycetota bacterium]